MFPMRRKKSHYGNEYVSHENVETSAWDILEHRKGNHIIMQIEDGKNIKAKKRNVNARKYNGKTKLIIQK